MKKVLAILPLLLAAMLPAEPATAAEITVYKSPTCGCCGAWVSHLEQNGFTVITHDVQDVTPYKERYGISEPLASCHTAVVKDYVIEGHVPAKDIMRLLLLKPDIRGLSVPGMPVGTPGMEQGERKDDYDVVAIHKDGSTSIFNKYRHH